MPIVRHPIKKFSVGSDEVFRHTSRHFRGDRSSRLASLPSSCAGLQDKGNAYQLLRILRNGHILCSWLLFLHLSRFHFECAQTDQSILRPSGDTDRLGLGCPRPLNVLAWMVSLYWSQHPKLTEDGSLPIQSKSTDCSVLLRSGWLFPAVAVFVRRPLGLPVSENSPHDGADGGDASCEALWYRVS